MVLIHFLCNGDETQKLWKPMLTQFSLQEAHRNGLHNGISTISFGPTAVYSANFGSRPIWVICKKKNELRINSNLQRNPHLVRNLL